MRKLDKKLLPCPEPSTGSFAKPPLVSLSPVFKTDGSKRELSPILAYILAEVQREQGLDQATPESSKESPHMLLDRVAERVGFVLSRQERDEVLAHIESDSNPFGILQPLVDDQTISDIIITNYSKISVQQGRRNFSTSLSFPDQLGYEAFVERILLKAGASYSTKKPIADGMIGAEARIHAVHKSLCESGPYITIRLNRFARVMLKDLQDAGLAPFEVLSYLQTAVLAGKTILVVGEVGTGKTTLARALAASLPAHESILVIEDTPEIRLEHPHVRYVRTREENTDGVGRVSPSECIRAGMRMAMNRIIFGEIRDAEAAESFVDVCASGHPGISTIHARSSMEAVARLELFLGRAQPGTVKQILSEEIVTAVQVIVFVDICTQTGRRRIMDVREIGPVADGAVRHREIFRYHLVGDSPSWKIVTRTSAFRDQLESAEIPVRLSEMPPEVALAPEFQYQDAMRRKVS